jgi:FkbM family methyltransferase
LVFLTENNGDLHDCEVRLLEKEGGENSSSTSRLNRNYLTLNGNRYGSVYTLLNSMIKYALHHTRRMLAGSKAGLHFVTKLRNQCELTIGRAHGWGISKDPELNGEARWARAVIDRLQYVVDVGANKGEWTELVLRQKDVKRALLFEPSLSAIEVLQARFSAHPEVEVVEAAAGNAIGSMLFFEEEGAGETSSLVAGFSRGGTARRVQLTTVDAEIEKRGWPSVDFLKIDAEGFDFRVLEGTRRLFEKGMVSYGQFEYNGPWRLSGTTLTFAVQWLRNLGYQCFLLKADGLHTPNIEFYREYYLYSNYAIIRNDLVECALQRTRPQSGPNLP